MINMNQKLIQISQNVLSTCLGLKKGESFLIVCDDNKKGLAESLYQAGQAIGAETMLAVMKTRGRPGEEPPPSIASAMKHADAAVCITEHSLTHTNARKEAAKAGTRIATMPGITEDMFLNGAIVADYEKVKERTENVCEVLSNGRSVRIEKAGYILTFSIDGRKGIPSTGMYLNPGESGNLPSGEAYIAPLEGTANGQIEIDGSLTGIGTLSSPLVLTIENGRITDAEGDAAEKLLSILGSGDGRCLGEFGSGTNDRARITGVVLEDEKVLGTIHTAFGSNNTFGGTIAAGVHIDGVVTKPTVYIDDELFMENGTLKKQS